MDLVKLKEATVNLKNKLVELAGGDDLAAAVLVQLTPLFNDIENDRLKTPIPRELVPGRGAFHHESPLQLNSKLYGAYAVFRVEVSGGIPEDLLKIIRSLDNK